MVVLAFGAFAATDGAAVLLMERFGDTPAPMTRELSFAVGLMGAVTIGGDASLLAVAATSGEMAPDQRLILWRRIGGAVVAWFVIDSGISIATGFWPNAVSNAVLTGAFFAIVRRV